MIDPVIQALPEKLLHGLWSATDDHRMAKDIPALSARYLAALGKPGPEVLPFYVLCRGYDAQSGASELFIGGEEPRDGLEAFALPAGEYARVTVRPKLGFLWGPAIGECKRAFYTSWLPRSDREALNLEYELHTEASLGKKPSVDLLFAVRKKA